MTNRRLGHSKRGRIAKTNKYFFQRGKRFSCLGPFALDHGFLSECIIEGAFNSDSFLSALKRCVLPFMNPFPGPRSVLLLDNCTIHHNHGACKHATWPVSACGSWSRMIPRACPWRSPFGS